MMNPFERRKNVVFYARASTKKQETSTEDQIRTMDLWLETVNRDESLELIATCEDKDVSGFFIPFDDRPKGKIINEMISRGEIDVLVVFSVDRIARNTEIGLRKFREFRESGVRIVALKENYDSSTSSDEFLLSIFLALAQKERDNTSFRNINKAKIIKQEIAKNGFFITKDGKKIENMGTPLRGEEAVREAVKARKLGFDMWALHNSKMIVMAIRSCVFENQKRASLHEIADRLKLDGRKNISGKDGKSLEWNYLSVRKVLERLKKMGCYSDEMNSVYAVKGMTLDEMMDALGIEKKKKELLGED